MTVRLSHLVTAACGLMLAGCSGSGGLTTAALIGGGGPTEAAAPAAPPPSDPTSRAVQVGATSARAARCGFYFDPGRLKTSWLAAEAAQGATPEQLQKVEREYEYIRLSVAKKTAGEADYCTDGKAREIKSDLNRHLAGDFTPPVKKQEAKDGVLAGLLDGSSSESKPFKPDEFFDKMGRTPSQR
ncbi:MAG: hypothetical protein KJZ80_11575 [Hyphomicrobiaceae bacterium]|nr:hypothetical protein [Hyphomicrobiaceae bacterium]